MIVNFVRYHPLFMYGNVTILEEFVAIRFFLDTIRILWIRPNPIQVFFKSGPIRFAFGQFGPIMVLLTHLILLQFISIDHWFTAKH